MKIRVILFLLFVASINAAQVNAQNAGNVIYNQNWKSFDRPATNFLANVTNDRVMEFEVKGLYNAEADTYMAIFNLTQVGETAKEADMLVNLRLDSFYNEILSLGVKKEDIYVDMVSLVPKYEYEVTKKLFSKSYNEIPKGFELQKNIHISFTDPKKLDKILTIAADNEIYDLVKVEYFVDNASEIYGKLQEEAVNFLKMKFKRFEALNIKLDTVYHVLAENSSVTYPIERYFKYQAMNRVSLDSKKKRGANITDARPPETMYYNMVQYNDYDLVINPSVLEPVVQYSYHLKVKFIVAREVLEPSTAKKVENHYKLISADGNVRTLEIK